MGSIASLRSNAFCIRWLERESWRWCTCTRRLRRRRSLWTFLQSGDQCRGLSNLRYNHTTVCWQTPLATMTYPEGGHGTAPMDHITTGQIDYIMVKKRFYSGIRTARTRTFPVTNVGSDRDMVMMIPQTRLEIKETNPSKNEIWHREANDRTLLSALHATIGDRFPLLATLVDGDADLDSMFTEVK